MLLPLLLALAPVVAQDEPSVIVRLNHDQFEVGDRGKIYVRTARDGFLVILHADPVGRIRVLFPIDPDADNFVRGDRDLELRSRSDREPLQMDVDGTGTVLAVFSLDPYTFDELTRNGHWDFLALGGPDESVKNDPLAALLEIARNMARENPFDYDAATYMVGSARYAAEYGDAGGGHLGIQLGFGYYPFGVGFSYGYPFYHPYYFVPFWGWYGGFSYGYRGSPGYTGSLGNGFTRKELGTLSRFEPNQPRPRSGFSEPLSVRGRSFEPRSRRIEPKSRAIEPRSRSIAPRSRSAPSRIVTPRGAPSRLSFGGSRSGIFRSFSGSFGGISRGFGGFSGSRGGFSTGARRR